MNRFDYCPVRGSLLKIGLSHALCAFSYRPDAAGLGTRGVARRAGVPVIGVYFGYTEVPIAELKPDRVIDHMSELRGAVESLAS